MDMSKLPKLSQTPSPPPDADPPAPQQHNFDRPVYETGGSSAAEVWISIALGLLLLLMSPRIWQYLFSPGTFSQKWTFSDPTGAPLAYTQTVFFWGDVALATFALVLIADGIVLTFFRKPAILMAALAFTAIAVAVNAVYVVVMVAQGYGVQLMSALAVIFGGYIALQQWRRIGFSQIG